MTIQITPMKIMRSHLRFNGSVYGGSLKSFLLKIFIALSQVLLIGAPGSYFGWLAITFVDSKIHFNPGAGLGKMMIGLSFTVLGWLIFGFLWMWIMKKTKISETEEFRFMTRNPWDTKK